MNLKLFTSESRLFTNSGQAFAMDDQGQLCLSCLLIDFDALFKQEIKCFQLGTLAEIAQRKSCSFCRFVVQTVNILWAKWKDEVWEPSLSTSINVWIKTTLWAHYGESSEKSRNFMTPRLAPFGESPGTPYFRYRPSLGTDWQPDKNQRSFYGSPRYTLCELDRIQDPGNFEYFTEDLDQDVHQVLSRRKIPPMIDRDLLKTWIKECHENHTHYMATKDSQQALLRSTGRFRVIDVDAKSLVVPSHDIDYIALSYVWGGILHTKTDRERVEWIESLFEPTPTTESTGTSSNELEYRLCLDNLPLTIKDTIKLTKLLGWRYIWIDLLCIRQHDVVDKEALVNKMHLIYEEASFTIVAAAGKDANTPLPGLFNPRHQEFIGEIVSRYESVIVAPSRPTLPDLLAETVWTSRGWTFQEDVLSRCCLYFTETEVFYSCSPTMYSSTKSTTEEDSSSEDDYDFGGAVQRLHPNEKNRSFEEYANFATEYSKRYLTNPTDAVGAMMGILNKFSITPKTAANIEAHGILSDLLEKALLWVSLKENSLQRREGFPSWSWAGWSGPVTYQIEHLGSPSSPMWLFQLRE
ncbi:hypothetical protein FBEOM_515 [Fusarium beomiforme]|uniref:Heterokaryon incompatibility domain-containing protein n=1 Tax=Fusarium beomiforme TaxID=44412 RepID=A0A9P5E513_9HYPO|nr:hypothetical protein FBEOM_515 [Fusarium beomiforme]